jgi:hypothetical protein
MTDTPQHIKEIQLKLWLGKPPGERLYQAIKDIDDMRNALRQTKQKMDWPLGDLDPMEAIRNKQNQPEDRI